MFDPRESIQVIGYDVEEDINPLARADLEQRLTKLNEELRLQNRYNKLSKKIKRLEEELERYINFCEGEANATVNDTNCRIAIAKFKSLLGIIRDE